MNRIILILGFFLSSILSFGQQEKLTFTPHWLPQAQFAGYYVALAKGFYQEAGINVEIKHPSASVMATEALKNGDADLISLFLITAIDKYNTSFPLVNVYQLSQNSALMFVTKKKNGISKLSQLDGKRIGIWESGFGEVPKTLMRENNYDITWVPILSTANLFMADGIDAMTVMWYNEYDQIYYNGLDKDEVNTFFMSDYGFNIPEDGIYCLQETYDNRKDDIKKFTKATERGWAYAAEHKAEALALVLAQMQAAHIPCNLAHQSWMLDCMLQLMQPGEKKVVKGELSDADFIKAKQILSGQGSEVSSIRFDQFFQPINNVE